MSELVLGKDPTLPEIQHYILAACKDRAFDKETLQDYFMLLTEEVGELAKALRKSHGIKLADDSRQHDIEDEVADVLWLLVCVCNKLDINLEQALRAKEEKNKKRNWA